MIYSKRLEEETDKDKENWETTLEGKNFCKKLKRQPNQKLKAVKKLIYCDPEDTKMYFFNIKTLPS